MLNQKGRRRNVNQQLLAIPNKLYFSIGEVSKLCNLKSHVLRYWEQEFPQLNPSKRRGNRRYYQRKDVLMVREIMSLLYEQGFTIEGARSKLNICKSLDTHFKANNQVLKEAISDLEALLLELEAN